MGLEKKHEEIWWSDKGEDLEALMLMRGTREAEVDTE